MVDVGVEHELLDFELDLVGELEPFAREKLDAVVLEGVVRGGNDRAGVGAQAARQKRDAGRRHRSDQQDVDTHGADARRHRGLQHVAGDPRVLPDHDARAVSRTRRSAKHVRDRAAETERGLRGHRLDVGDAAHAVGTEQLAGATPVRGGAGLLLAHRRAPFFGSGFASGFASIFCSGLGSIFDSALGSRISRRMTGGSRLMISTSGGNATSASTMCSPGS